MAGDGLKFRCILVGDGGSGKKTLIKRLSMGELERELDPILCVEVMPVVFHTTRGEIRFDVWNTAEQEKLGSLRDAYHIQGQCAMILLDVSSRVSCKKVPPWHKDLVHMCGKIPIVVCGIKRQSTDRKVTAKGIVYATKQNLPYYELEVDDDDKCEIPFLSLARSLVGDPKLEFVAMPELQMHIERGSAEAKQAALPEDDGDM